MAKKNPVIPPPANPAAPEEKPARKKSVLAPELQMKIDECKKTMASIKAIGKITKAIEALDPDGLQQLSAFIANKIENGGEA